jgi:tripartite-type tricarboxylate transporter receptor subunit TctC
MRHYGTAPRISIFTCILLAALDLTAVCRAQIDKFPHRAITLVAPYPPGGTVDALCRIIADKLRQQLGTPVIVENRPGAGGNLGVSSVAHAAPDGYTIVMAGTASLASSVTIYKRPLYDPVSAFRPIALVGYVPFVLVVAPSLGVNSVTELIALAKERPGQLSYGSGGAGSPHHLYAEMFKRATGINIVHVPYQGSTQALVDLAAGRIHLMFADIATSLPLANEGRIRALAVSSASRIAFLPDLPTVAEGGVTGYDGVGWAMIVAPSDTPSDIVSRLHLEMNAVLADSEVRRRIELLGITPTNSPDPAELRNFMEREIVRWKKVVESAGIAGTE